MDIQYFTVLMENLSAWPILAAIILIWLAKNREFLNRISGFRVGDFEVKLQTMEQQIEELQNELSLQEQLYFDKIEDVNTVASVKDLKEVRASLKATSHGIEDLSKLKHLLRDGAKPEEIYGAAVALRERPSVLLFDAAIKCLSNLAQHRSLKGVRLNFVWTLTSAVHKILIVDIKHTTKPSLTKAQLLEAKEVLRQLEQNSSVQNDRPDNPKKGIRGPISYSLNWIEKGLAKIS